jgi:hypothetical protein
MCKGGNRDGDDDDDDDMMIIIMCSVSHIIPLLSLTLSKRQETGTVQLNEFSLENPAALGSKSCSIRQQILQH